MADFSARFNKRGSNTNQRAPLRLPPVNLRSSNGNLNNIYQKDEDNNFKLPQIGSSEHHRRLRVLSANNSHAKSEVQSDDHFDRIQMESRRASGQSGDQDGSNANRKTLHKKLASVVDSGFQSDSAESEPKDDEQTESSPTPGGSRILSQLRNKDPSQVISFLNSQIVGRSLIVETVFGSKLKLYCDYTASGQDLRYIVDAVVRVEDYYANTHTETSITGAYMNHLLNEAEEAILKSMKASGNDYFVVGGGSGSTYAIEMAQKFLGTYIPPATKEVLTSTGANWEKMKDDLRAVNKLPLVVVSHYEHHSNEVTWRNQLCDIVETRPRLDGHINLDQLERLLQRNQHRSVIGSFSAGSNVTGIKTDVFAVATVLKKYGALAFFDYAAVGPYVAIDLSRRTSDDTRCLVDGVYISPHKFLGGPGSCGVLVFNRKCYKSTLSPSHGGGGTVDFVNRHEQLFTEEPRHREKSGTPGILQLIKAGLAFQLKSTLQPIIDDKERHHLEHFYAAAKNMKNLLILGFPREINKVGIISFLIEHNGPKGRRYLHQNFIVKLLNDMFGIQARSGCSCAGPYGFYLLGFDDETTKRYQFWTQPHPDLGDQQQIFSFKLGWARINLHYTMTDYEMDYLLFALQFVCENGWRFLPVYNFDAVSGQWLHDRQQGEKFPKFSIDSLLNDKRKYATSENMRRQLFEEQKKAASEMVLPMSKGFDSIPEMPYCFFYVEQGKIIDRKPIISKAVHYNYFFKDD